MNSSKRSTSIILRIIKPKKYDLIERTAKFREATIEFVSPLPKNEINRPLVNRIVRSGTNIEANYMKADDSVSKKDFENKVGISRKESKETMHWLRILAHANPNKKRRMPQAIQRSTGIGLDFFLHNKIGSRPSEAMLK